MASSSPPPPPRTASPETEGLRVIRSPRASPPASPSPTSAPRKRLLGLEGRLTGLILLPDQPLSRAPLAEIAPALAERPPESGTDLARLTDSFHLNLTAFGLPQSFVVGLFIVYSAIGLAFEQRKPLFRTLRALRRLRPGR
jgi:putative ABC transport system permease protein